MKYVLILIGLCLIYSCPGMAQSTGHATPVDLATDDEGRIYVAGSSMNSAGEMVYTLLAYSADGVLQPVQHFAARDGGPSIAAALARTNKSLLVTGSSPTPTSGHDIVTVSYPPPIPDNVDMPTAHLRDIQLEQSYPNPVTAPGAAVISYQIPVAGAVRLNIVDVSGREIALLVDEFKLSGKHSAVFRVQTLPAGTYYYRLSLSSSSLVKKLAVIR